ncbi:MAG: ABC transporter substrate-binding protein [Clostridia bacterium]|nr:ABC transporter substrate-binding protein [Clostridia bacterium]
MKKIISLVLALVMCLGTCVAVTSCSSDADYTVGVCQLMAHESLDQATKGFKDAIVAELEKAGKTVDIDVQIPADMSLCSTVVDSFVSKDVDLILANATPALTAAAYATTTIPVLGTSVTDYESTFSGNVPANVSGTSDAVPFDEQAQMMIDTLGLTTASKVGVIYCANESNSLIQFNAVKDYFATKGITNVTAYTFSNTNELQAVVTSAAAASDAIYIPSDNTVANNDTIVGTICSEQNIPVYTSYASAICYASLAIDYYQLGYETGKMAAEILLGNKTPADIEVMTITPTVVYNEEICESLGITVPEN